jgi:glutaredoxin-like protein NrdH
MTLIVYTKPRCGYCDASKTLLDSHDIEYSTIDITEYPQAMNMLMEAGHRTMPQIYWNDQVFVEGGYNGLSKYTGAELHDKINLLSGNINLGSL